jgi:hypothetical protein
LTVNGGDIPAFDNNWPMSPSGLSFVNTNKTVRITITPSNGSVSGYLKDATGAEAGVHGVVLQQQNEVRDGPKTSGEILLDVKN